MEYEFSGKLTCEYCGWKMRGKMERKKFSYICAKYNKNNQCLRNLIKQDEIIKQLEDLQISSDKIVQIAIKDKKIRLVSLIN